ncbi:MAG TPA: DUF1217 domain-containing protein [Acetobacteraceae bacterium]|nr:DUF1217 domain-containing protein [Acetobacteraceae bacterium]
MDLAISSLGIPDGVVGWNILQKAKPASFTAFMNDPVLKQQIAYFEKNAASATSAKDLLSNYQLQNFALTAFGLSSEQNMNGFMTKVLNSAPGSTTSFAASLTDPRFTAIAKAFNYGGPTTPAVPATASTAQVAIGNLRQGSSFSSFSGTFAGVTVSNLNLSGVTTWQGLAGALQTAFRQADGNTSTISVTLNGLYLKFSDSQGRGTASTMTFTADPANNVAQPTASAPFALVAGALAKPATGGPAVTNADFIKQVVQQYTEAQFQAVVGNTSNTLREALYAKQQLPSITNWYSVIANRPLADVIQTVLGLPQSFAMIDVDQQVKVLASRMNIANFQNPTKLNALLNQFVAMSQSTAAPQSAALTLLQDNNSDSGFINLMIPTTPLPDSLASNSAVALLQSTAIG